MSLLRLRLTRLVIVAAVLAVAVGCAVDLDPRAPYDSIANDVNATGMIVGTRSNSQAYRKLADGPIEPLPLPVGALGARAAAINAAGTIAGEVFVSNDFGGDHIIRWSPTGSPTDLGTLGPGPSWATGVNDAGTIIGNAQTDSEQYPEIQTIVPVFIRAGSDRIERLPLPDGAFGGEAYDINSHGTIVGRADFLGFPGPSSTVGAIWQTSATGSITVTALAADPLPVAINDAGELAGNSWRSTGVAAVRWSAITAPPVDLTSLVGKEAMATDIGENGVVVGTSIEVGGHWHAVRWDSQTSPAIDLGSLGGDSRAARISPNGIIVGSAVADNGYQHSIRFEPD